MSLSRHVLRRAPPVLNPYHLREFSSSANVTHHRDHQRTHEFLAPSNYLNSWETPRNPREAQSKLALLRREYAKQVKAVRKEYIREMEFQKLDKLKKDEARREALRVANEERKAAKAAEKKAKAKEREIAEEEFRQTLKHSPSITAMISACKGDMSFPNCTAPASKMVLFESRNHLYSI